MSHRFWTVGRVRLLLALIGLVSWAALAPAVVLALPSDCECPKLDCGPCAREEGVSFFTEKCDGGAKVKSCARPACVALDPMPSSCTTAAVPANAPNRAPAAVPVLAPTQIKAAPSPETSPIVGAIRVVKGNAWIIDGRGGRARASDGQSLRQGDRIVTENDGGVKVTFENGNEVHVSSSSELDLAKVDAPKAPTKQTLLKLLKGKVRSKVRQKYEGADSFYRVETRGAVAGVRGTDFVVTYEVKDREVMKVETLEGAVDLTDRSGEQNVHIPAGKYASYVVAANDSKVFGDDEISEFVARGYMTPVYEMSEAELKKVQASTEFVERALATVKREGAGFICSAPRGQLNQCAWTCENNPKGSDRCRTELPQVNCVRRRCNANGEWAEDSRLPASFHEACGAGAPRVGDCDY